MSETPLETEQLQLWLERMAAGDAQARDELLRHVCAQLERLTRSMLRRYPGVHRWEQTDDVLQNAILRLLRALNVEHRFLHVLPLLICASFSATPKGRRGINSRRERCKTKNWPMPLRGAFYLAGIQCAVSFQRIAHGAPPGAVDVAIFLLLLCLLVRCVVRRQGSSSRL